MRKELKKIDITGLKDTICIDLTAREHEYHHFQDLHGLDIALNELQKNPEQKIIIFIPVSIPGDAMKNLIEKQHKSDIFSLVSKGKNVRFFEYGDPKKLEHIFDTENTNKEPENTESEVAFQRILA